MNPLYLTTFEKIKYERKSYICNPITFLYDALFLFQAMYFRLTLLTFQFNVKYTENKLKVSLYKYFIKLLVSHLPRPFS